MLGTSASVALGAARTPLQQPEQAMAWGRFAGTGAEPPEQSYGTAEAPIGPLGQSRFG
jgi:hypothetical protein